MDNAQRAVSTTFLSNKCCVARGRERERYTEREAAHKAAYSTLLTPVCHEADQASVYLLDAPPKD